MVQKMEFCEHLHDVHQHNKQTIDERISIAKRQCQQQGVRFTSLRQKIYELILQANQPVGAYDLISMLQESKRLNTHTLASLDSKAQRPAKPVKSVAPPTVYRSLEFLLEQGLIHQLNSINAYIPCCHPRAQHTAAFLICDNCSHVQEYSALPVQEMLNYTKNNIGFMVNQSVIELRGMCQSCVANSA